MRQNTSKVFLPCRDLNSTTCRNAGSECPPGPIQRLYIPHRNSAGRNAPQNHSLACFWHALAHVPPSERPYLRPRTKKNPAF